MKLRQHAATAVWSIADQGIISAGNFLTTIVLARYLAPEEFGCYVLLLASIVVLQIFITQTLFFPLTICIQNADSKEQEKLLSANLAIATLFLIPGVATLASGWWFFGYEHFILPGGAYIVGTTLLNATRSGLYSMFRQTEVIIGDAIFQGGRLGLLFLLAYHGSLSLPLALWITAGASTIAFLIQIPQLSPILVSLRTLPSVLRDFWAIGKWPLGHQWLVQLRTQFFPWVLALYSGPAEVAAFQALMTVINLPIPLLYGLFAILPQAVAKAKASGGENVALHVSFIYLAIAGIPILAISALIFFAPAFLLEIIYGSQSSYLRLAPYLQVFVIASVASNAIDIANSFFYGAGRNRTPFLLDSFRLAAVAISGAALVALYGFAGSAIALLIANALSLIACAYILRSSPIIQP
jgi:O-antigen/teichoic acid export membrane protein